MSGNRFLEWFFRLLFPVALLGVIIYSFLVQPPLISSPEVKAGFAAFGSRPGYLEYVEPRTEPWPDRLHPLLAKALRKSFGPVMPQVRSFYFFGAAKQEMWGIEAPVGFETVILPGSGYSRQTSLSVFNLHLSLWQTGLRNERSWSRKDGKDGPTVLEQARTTFLLEQAVLLLPLARAGLSFQDSGPGRIRASLDGAGFLELEFTGDQLAGAAVGPYRIRVEERTSFGDFVLPRVLTGDWGQARLTELEIQGMVLNPPFDREALDSAADWAGDGPG